MIGLHREGVTTDGTRHGRFRWALAAAAAVVVALVAVGLTRCGADPEGAAPPAADGPAATSPGTAPGTSDTTAAGTTATPGTTAPVIPPVDPSVTRPSPSTTSGTPPAPPPGPAVALRRGDPNRRVVSLTFDAGSDTGRAAAILDTLAANGIRATFGMTGTWAQANPALLRRMAAEGHQLVNHTYDHPSFTGRSTGGPALSRAQRLDQLARADAAIRAVTGASTVPWFRPPYGDEDPSVRADVALAGYRYELLWTVDSLGWKGIAPADVVQRCLHGAGGGVIYLFHVGAASTDHAALQPIIDGLRAGGYGFVTATQLVGG